MEKYDEIVLAWRNQKIKNAAELEAVLSGYVIQFVYHSGKIENPKITYNDRGINLCFLRHAYDAAAC